MASYVICAIYTVCNGCADIGFCGILGTSGQTFFYTEVSSSCDRFSGMMCPLAHDGPLSQVLLYRCVLTRDEFLV